MSNRVPDNLAARPTTCDLCRSRVDDTVALFIRFGDKPLVWPVRLGDSRQGLRLCAGCLEAFTIWLRDRRGQADREEVLSETF